MLSPVIACPGTMVGPGSLGGIEWGSATDGKRIYVAILNLNHLSYAIRQTCSPWMQNRQDGAELSIRRVGERPGTHREGVLYCDSGCAHLAVPGFVGKNKFYAFSLGRK